MQLNMMRQQEAFTLKFPKGGQLDESRYESYSYTMRAK